jgi:hypothetical protein
MGGFDYPARPLSRIHGPEGYTGYDSYRPWLRDEFSFRCVYCLGREQWGHVTGEFALDHFVPQKSSPALATTYDNLVYSCTRCNLAKSDQAVSDPSAELTVGALQVQPDGKLEGFSTNAKSLILKLDLNAPKMVEWRLLWIRIIALAADRDRTLWLRIMGFPSDLPSLVRLRPPGGNSRPDGVAKCHFARAARGELPASY